MQDTFSIWFYDYDAKPSLLYRSAMRLRPESWNFTAKMQEAKWWVIYEPNQEVEQKIMAKYQEQPIRPIIVILSNEKQTEYHKSWAVLKMPLNYVVFFKWLDEVISKIQNGSLKDDQSLYKITESDENTFSSERWHNEKFKLIAWPNVGRFGKSAKVVELSALLLRNFHDLKFLKKRGFNEQLLFHFLTISEAHQWLVYEKRIVSEVGVVATQEVNVPSQKIDNSDNDAQTDETNVEMEAQEVDEKTSLFQTILKALKFK